MNEKMKAIVSVNGMMMIHVENQEIIMVKKIMQQGIKSPQME